MKLRSIIRKIHNNLITGKAVTVLGASGYASYLGRFLLSVPEIARAGNFRALDKSMGNVAKTFHYRGRSFLFDCQYCDDNLRENSFAFGIAREIYIRDCYFKWHPDWVYESAGTVVDLGANRGAFSTLMTTQANRIVSVECVKEYLEIISHNLSINNFKGYSGLESVFIGDGGTTESDSPMITIEELFYRHDLNEIDLIKMDIEGSEFSLFEKTGWLTKVKAISMEVHSDCGNPESIVTVLEKMGFSCRVADENLVLVADRSRASFIYAWKGSQKGPIE